MSKINILDKFVSNRISAGEVVDKPSSVVKELVENSIDAGSTKIIIEIESGGTKKIEITDNGSGIEREDLKLAFLPHATSKIKNVDDLDKIGTLGFRGEALASISAVSQVVLKTKTANESVGSALKVDGGEFGEISEIAMNQGTKISVNNIFYNTPARRKFLRKNKTEESEITDLVEKLILSNPTLSIKYIIDGKIKYDITGGGLYTNIYTIYGKEIINNLLEVNFEREGYRLYGYIGKPEISKPNRTYQTLIVNGRIVRNGFVSNVIQEVYQDFLMKNKFPFFVLCLTLPVDSVDVNVHPSKTEIKFENLGFIRNLFSNAVYMALANANYTRNIGFENQPESQKIQPIFNADTLLQLNKNEGVSFSSQTEFESSKDMKEIILTMPETDASSEPKFEANSEESRLTDFVLSTKKKAPFDFTAVQESIEEQIPKAKLLGVCFKTYIIVEEENSLYLIDQHAAHERQLYDKFVESVEQNDVLKQGLLSPYIFKLNSVEADFISRNLYCLKEVGFDIEENDNNSFKITSIPYILTIADLEDYINHFITTLQDYTTKGEDYFKSALMQHACKMAVKSGQVLSLNEIEILIKKMKEGVLLCPHGRPIVIEVTKAQIEKWFKRVL